MIQCFKLRLRLRLCCGPMRQIRTAIAACGFGRHRYRIVVCGPFFETLIDSISGLFAEEFILMKMSSESAGANAASSVDMAFSTTEPLSEIVWSPNKGFSLDCVDSSFADKNISLYRDVEPSGMVLALLQSVTGGMSTIDESVDEGSDGNMEKMYTARGVPNLPNDQANTETSMISEKKKNKFSIISGHADHMPVDNSLHQADEPQPCMEQNPSPRKHSNGGMDISFGNQVVVAEDGLYTEVEHINEYEGSDALKSSSRSPSEKLGSTEENNLQTFNCEATCAATSRVLVSKSNESKNKSQGNELMLLYDKNLLVFHSPCNSRIHMIRNIGKEKSLSDGDENVSLLKEENDSRLSVESCYRAGLFSIGTKSVKLNPGGDDTVLTLYYLCDSVHLSRACQPDQELVTCHKIQDPEPQNTGSKSNFLSTYSQTLKNVGTRKSHLVAEASEDFEISNEVHGIDVPITCYAENSSLYRQYFQSNKFQVSTPRYDAGPSLQPKIRPRKFLNNHENRENGPVECRNCYQLGLSKEKEGMALHSSSTRHNKNNNENVECYALSQRKETNNIFHKSDNLEGLDK